MSTIPALPSAPHIAFLHTSPVHIATFDHLLTNHLPTCDATHTVDVSLLDTMRETGPTPALRSRIEHHLATIVEGSPDLIVCTCSSIGPIAETASLVEGCPVIRVDRPMAEEAVRLATGGQGRIGIAATLASTLGPTTSLLEGVATERGIAGIDLSVIPCFDAWEAFEAGDSSAYATRIAGAVAAADVAVDVIVFAQASMAGALPLLAHMTTPILTSPAYLMIALTRAVTARTP